MANEKVAFVFHSHDGSRDWSDKEAGLVGTSTTYRGPREWSILQLSNFLTAFAGTALGSDQSISLLFIGSTQTFYPIWKEGKGRAQLQQRIEKSESEGGSCKEKSRYSACPMRSICSSLTRCLPPTSWSAIDCILSGQEGDNNATMVQTFIHQQESCRGAIPPSTTLPDWMPSPSFS